MRIIVVLGCFLFTKWLVYDRLSFLVGLPLGGLLAAGAICLELWLSSVLRRQPLRDLASWRLLVLDRLFAGPENAIMNRGPVPNEFSPSTPPAPPAKELEAGETEERRDDGL